VLIAINNLRNKVPA